MGKLVKYIASVLCALVVLCSLSPVVFADSLLDPTYDTALKNFNYVWGQETSETGVICPKCGTAIRKIDHWTCPNCGYNSMVVDSDGKTTFTTGGGKANSTGVGRPKAYKEDNTPAVLSTGEYTMYVHPTFVRRSTGLPYVNGTQAVLYDDGESDTDFITSTLDINRVTCSFYSVSSSYTFSINSNVYYYITAPVTGNYQFFDWKYTDVKCAGSFQDLDKKLSVQILNLHKGDTNKEVYFYVQSNAIYSGGFTYISAPDLMVKYTPFNEKTQSYQPLEKVPSIKANDKEITGTIYHDPVNNYYYSYDSENNCTIYVENKKGDIIGDITYNTTENTYVTNIYPGATTGEDTPTPAPTEKPGGSISTPETGKPGSSSGSGQSWWDKLLDKIGNAVIDGLLGAVSAVLKLIFKLFSTILGWIIWAVSLVFTLFPFLPPGLSGLLVGGVVVCFIIGIIKFIRG